MYVYILCLNPTSYTYESPSVHVWFMWKIRCDNEYICTSSEVSSFRYQM